MELQRDHSKEFEAISKAYEKAVGDISGFLKTLFL
jgi:hypothetical protein